MTGTPRPGRPVRGSRTGRPIMALIDLLGRRWTLRVIWELRAGRLTFRPLQEACGGVSPTVLNERLRELRESGLVDLAASEGYGLTALGRELIERFLPLVEWSARWAKSLGAAPAAAPQRATGGRRSIQGRARSSWAASRKMVASSPKRPTS